MQYTAKSRLSALTGLFFLVILMVPCADAQVVPQPISIGATSILDASSGNVVRDASQPLSLGFNTPWNAIQGYTGPGNGIWDDNIWQVWPEVTDFLRTHFPGAVYRYSGGTVSDYFNWKQSIGPLSGRTEQWAGGWTGSEMVPKFGLDEFMDFVDEVKGTALITVNVSTMNAQDAANMVEYLNAENDGTHPWAALRAHSSYGNHADPYRVKIWELGNELDFAKDFKWTSSQYIDTIIPVIQAMRAVDPDILIIPHTASGSNLGSGTWYNWHRAILDEMQSDIDGMATHIYYDGNNVSAAKANNIYAITVSNDTLPNRVYLTEHARDIDWSTGEATDQTTWPRTTAMLGTLETADMLIGLASNHPIALAQWHSLSGTGPWRLFNSVDPVTGKYSNNFGIRPVAWMLALFHKSLPGRVVLQTNVTTPDNNAGYTGEYDVRGVVLREQVTNRYSVLYMNRHSGGHSVTVRMPADLAAGNYLARLEYVGGADMGQTGIQSAYLSVTVDSNHEF